MMTEKQQEFWRALTAPFPREAYKTRKGRSDKTFTYLDSRTIMNRLDDVVGPGHWDIEFRECARGIICRLTITAPGADGKPMRCWKEGGGSFRAMQDEDSTFKTGFSSAIKVAAATLGIGRDLYGHGMPMYCADLHGGMASGSPVAGPGTGPPPREERRPGRSDGRSGGDLNPPYGKPGKAPYAWAKSVSDHFQIDVLARMTSYAEKRKKPKWTNEWDEAFLDECLAKTVEWLRTLENYDGEFGESRPEPQRAEEPRRAESSSVAAAITAAVKALIHTQTGRHATDGEVIAMVQEVASSVPDGSSVTGAVMKSLSGCTDEVWMKATLKAINARIQEAAQLKDVPNDDIPF